MKNPAALIVSACLLTNLLSAAPHNDAKSPDPAVVEKLEEIVTIRERLAETARLEFELGKVVAYNEAAIELAEAKIALASEKDEPAVVVSELTSIVRLRQEQLDREKALVEDSRRTEEGISAIRIKLLEAEVRLHRARTQYGIK
ncbi:hypothetical protein VSU19_14195 [Verrucomicrobiales bacterium BCK34]|nr:hypothetical protein [Verrucomicrobiales bacterium BCK34]